MKKTETTRWYEFMKEAMKGKILSILIIISIIVMHNAVFAEDFGNEPRSITIYRVDNVPKVDGKPKEFNFKGGKADTFRTLGGGKASKAKTEVYGCYDAQRLYFCYICCEDNINRLKTHHEDHHTRQDYAGGGDSIEIFLDPFLTKKFYSQFSSSIGGEKYDQNNITGGSWDPEWEFASSVLKDRWIAELSIPFKSLSFGNRFICTPNKGDIWGINFCRYCVPNDNEWSSWNRGSFHKPEEFGKLIFAGRNDDAIKMNVVSNGNTYWGYNELICELTNEGEKEAEIKSVVLESRDNFKIKSSTFTTKIPPKEKSKVSFPYSVLEGGSYSVNVTLIEKDKEIIAGQLDFVLPEYPKRLNEFYSQIEKYRNELEEKKDNIVSSLLVYLDKIHQNTKDIRAKWDNAIKNYTAFKTDYWRNLSEESEKILSCEKEIKKDLSIVKFKLFYRDKGIEKPEYGMGILGSGMKMDGTGIFEGELSDSIELELAKNEYENTQFVIVPFEFDLKDVKIAITDLKDEKTGKILLKDNIQPYLVGFVNGENEGPDPLLKVEKFDVRKRMAQPIWITLYASKDQPPGIYEGSIKISPANSARINLKLKVTIWDFVLSDKRHLRTDMWFHDDQVERFYFTGMTPEEYEKWAGFYYKYRIGIYPAWMTSVQKGVKLIKKKDGSYHFDFTELDKYLEISFKYKLNVLNINFCCNQGMYGYCFWANYGMAKNPIDEVTGKPFRVNWTNEELQNLYLQYIKELCDHLKKKGWFEAAVYQGYDEASGERLSAMKKTHKAVRDIVPDLKRQFASARPNQGYDEYADIWTPHMSYFSPAEYTEKTMKNHELWWYVTGSPCYPSPTVNIQAPGIAHRIIFWFNWKYKVTGFLYWGLNIWVELYKKDSNTQKMLQAEPSKRWPNTPWIQWWNVGDGFLSYPGPDGPLSSIRLENIRDGIEDYEYFYMLNELLNKLKATKQADKLIDETEQLLNLPDYTAKNLKEYGSSKEIYKYRQRIAKQIEKIEKRTGKISP